MNQGYEHSRFEITVDENFHCPICMNVLKDPVQCQRNQHYFCTPCITEHLKNSQTCPLCMEELTPQTLAKPARIVAEYLSGLRICCEYAERGCPQVVELGILKTHVTECQYSPVICSNDKCMTIVNKQDKENHEKEVCEFRTVQCQDCNEEMSHKMYKKHGCLLSKEVDKIKLDLLEIKDQLGHVRYTQEEMLKLIRNVIDELKVTKNTKQTMQYPTRLNTMSDIVVLGGINDSLQLDSVETFSWANMAWTPLPPMRHRRASATAVCYQNQIIVTGGRNQRGVTNSIERMLFNQTPEWLDFPAELPCKSCGHKCVVHNSRLLIVGGLKNSGQVSNAVHEVLLQPPYTSTFKCRLPHPLAFYGSEYFSDKILIMGGTPTSYSSDSVETVMLYSINNNECKQMPPLPFALADMATVRRGDDVLIIGGTNREGKALNTVLLYNHKNGQCKTLPSMKYKRSAGTAVIVENTVVVMGGYNKEQGYLNSVECFNVDNYLWEELPPMYEHRKEPTAVLKLVNFDEGNV